MPVTRTRSGLSPWLAGFFMGMALCCGALQAEGTPALQEHPGAMVPLDVPFLDETGRRVTFGEVMGGRPAIVTLNYYDCPSLCTPQLQDLARSLAQVQLDERHDYRVITLSFNPDDTPEKAARKKANLLAAMRRPFAPDAWRFLTGSEADIRRVTQSVGFGYAGNPGEAPDFTHPAVLIALAPDGKITRYLNGIKQLPFDIQMALMEASQGTVRPTIAKTLLFCFAFDPENKRYVFAAEKVAAVALSLLLAGFFLYLVRAGRDKRALGGEDA